MNQKLNLIFDLDGTLIDSSEGVVESVNYALEKASQPAQPSDRIKRYIGCPLPVMFADFTDHPFEELIGHFREKAETAVVQSARPLPGVEQTLKVLHNEGYTMGIATTKIRSQLDNIIQRLGWSEYFTAVSGGDEVVNVKPAPDIFLLTIERMKTEGEPSIVIGDTSNDVFGAKAAGLKVIAVPSECGDPKELQQSEPDYFLKDFDQLPDLLKNVSSNNS